MRISMWTVFSVLAVFLMVSPVAAQSLLAPYNPTGKTWDVSSVQRDGSTYTVTEWFDSPSYEQALLVFGGYNSSVDYFFTRALAAMNTGLGADASWSLITYVSLEGAFHLETLEAWAENEPSFAVGDLRRIPASFIAGYGGVNLALTYNPTLNDMTTMGPNWHWVQLCYTNIPRNVLDNTAIAREDWLYTDTSTGLTYFIDSAAQLGSTPFYDTLGLADTTGFIDAAYEVLPFAGTLPSGLYYQFVTFVAWEGALPHTFYLSYTGVGWGYGISKN